MKSQSAIEFMTIVALGIILIGAASYFGIDYITSYLSDTDLINARQTVDSITSASNIVYAQSVGANSRIPVVIPRSVVRERTYASGNQVNIRFDNGGAKDVFRDTKPEIFGALPTYPGNIYLNIRMRPEGNHTPRGAYIYVEELGLSMIFVGTYEDYSLIASNFTRTFNQGETVNYLIITENESREFISSNLNIQIYYPNQTLSDEIDASTNSEGKYNNSFTASESGVWLISAMNPDTRLIGTALVWVD